MANKTRNRGSARLTGPAINGHRIMTSSGYGRTIAPGLGGGNYRGKRFAGVGLPKSPRRSNGGRPRKMYPYVRKDQKGTPVETMINKNYDELQKQYNELNRGPGRMDASDATGRFGTHWNNVKKFGTTGKAIGKYIGENGGSVAMARKELVGRHKVSFGADPVTA